MSVTIHLATADDAEAILALPDLGASTRRLLEAALRADDHVCLVARAPADEVVADPGTVVGVAIGLLQADDGHIADVAVAPSRRRAGIASMLLAELQARLRDRGATGATLEVRPGNAAARSLYRQLGFVDEGRRPGYYPDGEDAVLMWRRDLS
ncbi:MAG: GNAT family N-acetyltransferase [Nitriliruptor sp.]|uniref:GNAT family N-acetyltransferase n=1 Tax=Nitriliruptor sp. TaxID=2448056 RepID=UPI00349FE4A5